MDILLQLEKKNKATFLQEYIDGISGGFPLGSKAKYIGLTKSFVLLEFFLLPYTWIIFIQNKTNQN